MLKRILETEIMDTAEDARQYDRARVVSCRRQLPGMARQYEEPVRDEADRHAFGLRQMRRLPDRSS